MSIRTNTPIAATDVDAWTGLVLAGGRSTRMGQDKALLRWRGRSLIEHQTQTLREAGARTVLLSGNYPKYGGIADRLSDRGPLAGVQACLERVDTDWLMIVPVDMPMLNTELLHGLLTARAAGTAALCYQDTVLPLLLACDHGLTQTLSRLLDADSRQRSLRRLHASLDGQTVSCPASLQSCLRGCNTPEQWQQVRVDENPG